MTDELEWLKLENLRLKARIRELEQPGVFRYRDRMLTPKFFALDTVVDPEVLHLADIYISDAREKLLRDLIGVLRNQHIIHDSWYEPNTERTYFRQTIGILTPL